MNYRVTYTDNNAPLCSRVEWTTCLPLTCVAILSAASMVMAAVTASICMEVRDAHDTCDFYYDTTNSVTSLELGELALFGSGIFGVPRGKGCACFDGQPAYIAPRDLCDRDNFPRPSDAPVPGVCLKDSSLEKLSDHVLVCLSQAKIDTLWQNGFCHPLDGPPILHRGRLVCECGGSTCAATSLARYHGYGEGQNPGIEDPNSVPPNPPPHY